MSNLPSNGSTAQEMRKVTSQRKGGNRVYAYHNDILRRMLAAGWERRPDPTTPGLSEWRHPQTGEWMNEHRATLLFMAYQPLPEAPRRGFTSILATAAALRRRSLRKKELNDDAGI